MTTDLIARLEALARLWKPSQLTNVLLEAVAALTAQAKEPRGSVLCMNMRCHLMREHTSDECGWPDGE